ncbi:hypothetical protein FB45DRAFT_409189 [Roridomyces roridus]|uniref:Uncharacterized protein n=1 Tax=Roridomyces roridus TaxID=1738132 RepID=A0AAD7C4N9_9AGAR|nr:hypothetical protein FB45DRAFT_409189 [Roridomyces roridus]
MYSSPPSSPTSPTRSTMRHKTTMPSGFRPAPKPKRTPIAEMSVRELQDLHNTNTRLLSSPYVSSDTHPVRLTPYARSRQSTSSDAWITRLTAEQDAIQGRLVELLGVDAINTGLKNTTLKGEDDMNVDLPSEPYISPALEAKRKALSRFGPANDGTAIGSLSMQEAIQLEQQAHQADKERQERLLEKRKRMGLAVPGEQLTRKEREERMWAFMNHKPSDSDLEDDSEEDYDDEDDPASWFADQDEDGRKGQLIVEPDEEDFGDIIRVDSSKLHYNSFYEPRTEGD